MFVNFLRGFMVEIFFSNLFERLLTKDSAWESIIEDKKNGANEQIVGVLTEVINVLSTVFKKRSEDSDFDKFLNDEKPVPSRAGNIESSPPNSSKKTYLNRIKTVTDLVFEGIAQNNSEGFDVIEINLIENIRHSFSDKEDVLSLTSGEMSTYKQMFVDIYKHRDKYNLFLSHDENFIDPLRSILNYLYQDEMENTGIEIADEVLNINIELKNKFYDVLNSKIDTAILRRCSFTSIVLPQQYLQESDRIYIYELHKKGWPCLIRDKVTGHITIHHHNDLLELNCKGYSIETNKFQKKCDQYIGETSLRMSSVFDKVSVYTLFPNDTDDISIKFEILNLMMNLLKGLPDMEETSDLLTLLTASDRRFEGQSESDYEAAIKYILKKDRGSLPMIEKLRNFFNCNIDAHQKKSNRELYARRMNLLLEKVSRYLNYIENHKNYQERCARYISEIDNTIKEEINRLEKGNGEMIRGIYSMLDDLVEKDQSLEEVFKEILRPVERRDDELTSKETDGLKKIIEHINETQIVEQFTLFDLESLGVVRNFSFAKQSKFFDIEKDVFFDITCVKDVFIFRIVYIESTVSIFSRFTNKENLNSFNLDEFHISFTVLYELLAVKTKGNHIFLGQYTLFDTDKLLDLLVDILGRKLKIRNLTPVDVLEDVEALSMHQEAQNV